jgi:hypothetical protein
LEWTGSRFPQASLPTTRSPQRSDRHSGRARVVRVLTVGAMPLQWSKAPVQTRPSGETGLCPACHSSITDSCGPSRTPWPPVVDPAPAGLHAAKEECKRWRNGHDE